MFAYLCTAFYGESGVLNLPSRDGSLCIPRAWFLRLRCFPKKVGQTKKTAHPGICFSPGEYRTNAFPPEVPWHSHCQPPLMLSSSRLACIQLSEPRRPSHLLVGSPIRMYVDA